MDIGHIITIVIAVAGWIYGICMQCRNRKLQKRDMIANRKYEKYSRFLVTCDELIAQMNQNPINMVGDTMKRFTVSVMQEDGDSSKAMEQFIDDLSRNLENGMQPLQIMSNEMSALKLDASPTILSMIDEFQALTRDFFNEFHNCLALVSTTDINSTQILGTIGHNERYQRVEVLYKQLREQMRKEIQIK